MEEIHISLFYEPGESHISSLLSKAEFALGLGLIKRLPIIKVSQSKKMPNFWHFILTINNEDRPFWLGFCEGKDFAANNRQIAVGSDS